MKVIRQKGLPVQFKGQAMKCGLDYFIHNEFRKINFEFYNHPG
jgi:hypothetical protein